MPLKLMYLTNDAKIARIADSVSIDRVFLDLELRGKVERQGNLNMVISHHRIEDVRKIKQVLTNAQLLVRVNSLYEGSRAEIDRAIADGADIVMLPYFKTAQEVQAFIGMVGGRAKAHLLCETPQAVANIDEILAVPGIDEIHIGLNDLHLGYQMTFMFQLLADGTVERLCEKIKAKGIAYGFGGVGRLGGNTPLSAERIIEAHYRLGSQAVILSRSFCDTAKIAKDEIYDILSDGVKALRAYEEKAAAMTPAQYAASHDALQKSVAEIVCRMQENRRI